MFGILILSLVVFKLKAISLVLSYLATAFGACVYCLIYIRKYANIRISVRWIKEIVRIGLPAGINGISRATRATAPPSG